MDGVDTTWARVPGGAEIGSLIEKAIADFKKDEPGASVPALLAIRAKLATIASDPVVDGKRATLAGTILVPGVTHGIGISAATGTGYTDDSEAGVAVPFDLANLKTGTPIKTAPDADGIVMDPASGHLLVINGDSGSISVLGIDALADPEEIGKPTGRDVALGRPSATTAFGIEGAVKRLETLVAEAIEVIPACPRAGDLRALIMLEAQRLMPKKFAQRAA